MRADRLWLNRLFSRRSNFALLWNGYAAHSLLFYRQNRLDGGLRELAGIGRRFAFAGGDPSWPQGPAPEGRARRLAQQAAGVKDLRLAARLAARACALEPESGALAVLKGMFGSERYWGSIRFSAGALADFERGARLDPENPWAWLFAGMALEMRRDYVRAIARLDEAARLAPRWSWPLILRGICLWYIARFKEAIGDFKRAAKLDPENELPLLFLARAKSDLKDPTLVKDLDRALRLAPRSAFVLSWRGRAQFVLKRTPAALSDLRRARSLLPDYDRCDSWLGISYAELGRWAPARRCLERAAVLNPFYPTTLYPLAAIHLRNKDWREAAKVLKRAAAVDRHGVWVEHRISMNHANPACRRSLEDLTRFLDARPRAAWAWAWRGQTRLLLKDYHAAISDLESALRLTPRDAWARLWKAETLRRLGRTTEALAEFEGALALDAALGWAHAGRGACLLAAGQWKEALASIERSLRLQGPCGPALAWRGEALYRLGRWAEAAASFEAALERSPHQLWINAWLWKARARLADWPAALASLQSRLKASAGQSAATWALIGWVRGRLGQAEEASRALARALDLDPANPLAGEAARGALTVDRALSMEGQAELPAGTDGIAGHLSSCREKIAAGDYAGAIEEASRALDESMDPLDPHAWRLRAAAKARQGDAQGAQDDRVRMSLLFPHRRAP